MKTDISVLTEFDPTLFSCKEAPLVSLYMPTHRHAPENQQDPIRYKNLMTEVENLLELNYDRNQYEGIMAALRSIEEHRDSGIWRNAKDGLAILASNEKASIYKLDYPVDEFVSVTDSYHIKPLIRNFQFGSHYYLIALSADDFALYEGDFHTIEKLKMPEGVETRFSEVFDDFDNTLLGLGGTHGSHAPSYHRYGDKSEVIEKETIKHFRYASKIIEEHFASKHRCPFILVSLPEHQNAFREVSSIPTLLDESIEKPFYSMDEKEVLEEATSIIEGIQKARIAERTDRLGSEISQGRASTDPREVAHALAERKVETLFIERGELVPGTFDPETGSLSYGADALDASDDLTDDFAQAAYLQGGDVYVLDADRMPSDTGVAALFRY